MAEEGQVTPEYDFYTYFRYKIGAETKRLNLLVKRGSDQLELIDLARKMVAANLITEVYIVPHTPSTTTDGAMLSTWLQLATQAVNGPIRAELAGYADDTLPPTP